jgi:transposase
MADLTDVQWERIRPLVAFAEPRRADNRGRPWRQARQVLNGMLWVLRTGAPWHDLPERYGPYQTCHRRFQQWQRAGVLDGILWALAEDLLARGQLGLEETFIDASFMGAKKGAIALNPDPRDVFLLKVQRHIACLRAPQDRVKPRAARVLPPWAAFAAPRQCCFQEAPAR